ncbi:GntR family transcriptional regulator [Bordetella sp. BOR01]|nr:GntR family transcriptional regulator [Bordetella sp. BOR01]MBV7482381.1 GntR family transcriptional regulator [Bordetella sp. BOR01]
MAVQKIRDCILYGRFALGQRLIARELMTELGVGRSTLREAFGKLAADGLLELTPNRGAAVRRMSRAEMRQLFQIRESLEGLAAQLAAEQIDKDDHRQLMEAALRDVQRGPAASNKEFMLHNQMVHNTILKIGGNDQLVQLLGRIHLPLVMAQVNQSLGAAQIAQSTAEHAEIVHAILAGSPAKADAAMRRHLRRSGTWTLGLPDDVFKPS